MDAGRKQFMLGNEAGGFIKSIVKDKAYTQEIYNYNGYTATIYKGHGDGEAATKVACIKKGMRTIVDKGVALPPNLRFYCIADTSVQNRAFVRDGAWNSVAYITLAPSMLQPGDLQSISNSVHPGFEKGDVTAIHEMGHAIHAHQMGEAFLDTNANGGCNGEPTGANAVQVSGYAGMNKKEYVAEVFTGLILGRAYAHSVMQEYAQYNGPAVP